MTPTKEMIAMAERIAGRVRDSWWSVAYEAALAAIMETSEKAAHHLFTQGQFEAAEAIRNGEHLRCR